MRIGGFQLRASSLLIFQSVLKGAVGEAFLAALAATQKYQVRRLAVCVLSARCVLGPAQFPRTAAINARPQLIFVNYLTGQEQ